MAYPHATTVHEVQTMLGQASAAGTVVVLDFYAPWCGPCKKLEPTLAALAQQYGTKVQIVKLDVDKTEDKLTQHFQVMSVPTFIFIRTNQVVATQNGGDAASLTQKFATVLQC